MLRKDSKQLYCHLLLPPLLLGSTNPASSNPLTIVYATPTTHTSNNNNTASSHKAREGKRIKGLNRNGWINGWIESSD